MVGDASDVKKTDAQIMSLMKTMEGMKAQHLMLLYNVLDMDRNGNLDHEEVHQRC